MRLLSPILANLILISAGFGLGNAPRHLFPPKISRLDRTTTTLLGGLGLLGTLLFLIGLVHFSLVVIFAYLVLIFERPDERIYRISMAQR
jgi:hypothetical protein